MRASAAKLPERARHRCRDHEASLSYSVGSRSAEPPRASWTEENTLQVSKPGFDHPWSILRRWGSGTNRAPTKPLQFQDVVSYSSGVHAVRAGGGTLPAEQRPVNFGGSFELASLADFEAGRPIITGGWMGPLFFGSQHRRLVCRRLARPV
jgi:hypothetical protein